MVRSWIHLLIIIFLLSGLYLFTDMYIALLALIIIIALVTSSGILLFVMKRKLNVELESSWSTYKTKEGNVQINIRNKGILPMTKVKCTLIFYNRLTEEKMTKDIFFIVRGKDYIEVPLHFNSGQVGKVEVSVQKLTIYDYLHIFATSIPSEIHDITYIIPTLIPIHFIEQNKQMSIESGTQQFNDIKDPNGLNMIGIKEYSEEDNVKHIHWKLTDKFNSPIVKEYSEPFDENILVLYDPVHLSHPQAISTSIEVFISLSNSLIDQGYEHKIGWFDHNTNKVREEDIHMREQLISLQSEVLAIKHDTKENNSIKTFVMNTFHHISHVFLVTSEANQYLEDLHGSNHVTVLMYMNEVSDKQKVNSNQVVFRPTTLEEDLSYLTI